jgi:hypothetical protein
MSGVAKDDTNPTQPTDDTVPAAGAAEAGSPENQTSEADARASRRNAPHLRVVTENDSGFGAPAADAPHLRIGAAMHAAREILGYSLDQVSKETRVHLSHLRAIEEMTPNLLGAPVYAKGYIKAYARFLGMDEQTTLDRYLSECAILKDPEKQDIAPPATSKSRKLPVAAPMLGILIVALIGGGAFVLLSSGDKQPAGEGAPAIAAASPSAATGPAAAVGQRLRLVALRSGSVEVRSAKGDKYVHRDFVAGESYSVRVGAGWTVSVNDGSAFEWRLGEQSLGPLAAAGPVYSQSVDLAAQRTPIVIEPVIDPNAVVAPATPDPSADAYPPATTAPAPAIAPPRAATGPATVAPPPPRATPAPAKPKPKPPVTPPAATALPPVSQPPAQPVTPPKDPALAAYPDQ